MPVRFVRLALNVVLPARCVLCKGHLHDSDGLCAGCVASLGSAIVDDKGVYLGGYQKKLQTVVHALKFGQVRNVASPLARSLAEGLKAAPWPVDVVVPVPLHPWRNWERGYNQAEVLALALGKHLGLPVLQALRRTRSTKRQAQLNREARLKNVQDAFRACTALTGKHVLLVDDVFTTGATLSACSAALVDAGAISVHSAVISRA